MRMSEKTIDLISKFNNLFYIAEADPTEHASKQGEYRKDHKSDTSTLKKATYHNRPHRNITSKEMAKICNEFEKSFYTIQPDEINNTDDKGKTLLMHLAEMGFAYGVDKALAAGADANIHDNNGFNALFYAVSTTHIRCIQLIAERTENINYQYENAHHSSAIHILISNSDKKVFGDELNGELSDIMTNGKPLYFRGEFLVNVNMTISSDIFGGPEPLTGYTIGQEKTIRIIHNLQKYHLNLNLQNADGYTPFMLACTKGLQYLAHQMLALPEIDFTLKDATSGGYLRWGATLKDLSLLDKLLKSGVDINSQTNNYDSILHLLNMSDPQWNEMAKWLIDHGINTNLQNKTGETALVKAAQYNNVEIIHHLLTHGAKHDIPTNQGAYPWHMAAYCGALDALKILRTVVGDLDLPTNTPDKLTALWYAAKECKVEVVDWLAEQGANVNSTNNVDGNTALHTAIRNYKMPIISLLIDKHHVNPNTFNAQGLTALHIAAFLGHEEAVSILLKHTPVDILSKSTAHVTPLWFAAQEGKLKIVKLLIEKDANPNSINADDGISVLQIASSRGHKDVLGYLIAKGANLNIQDIKGDSSLHQMIYTKNNEMAKWLIDHGIDTNLQNQLGETALVKAAQHNNVEIIHHLLTHGARHDIPTNQGIYPWHMAAYCGALDALQALKPYVNDVDLPSNNQGKITALWYAAKEGKVEVVDWLATQGANVDYVGSNGIITTLEIAIKHRALAELLIPHIKNPDSLKKALTLPNLSDELKHIIKEQIATIEQSDNLEGGAVANLAPLPVAKQEEHKMKDVKTLWAEMSGRDFSSINKILYTESGKSIENLGMIAAKAIEKIDKAFLPEILLFGMSLKQFGIPNADDVIKSAITTMAVINVKRPASNQELQKCFAEKIEEILLIENAAGLLHDSVASLESTYRVDEYNSTVLHKAAHNGHPGIIKLLFNAGWINIDPSDIFDRTPLYFAVISDHVATVKELLVHDPDIFRNSHTFQPIATVMDNIPLWEDIFIEYAKSHFSGDKLSFSKPLLAEISAAISCAHIKYGSILHFFQEMNFDVTGLAQAVLDDVY